MEALWSSANGLSGILKIGRVPASGETLTFHTFQSVIHLHSLGVSGPVPASGEAASAIFHRFQSVIHFHLLGGSTVTFYTHKSVYPSAAYGI